MTPHPFLVDAQSLSVCAQEPIHVPGAIQAHGCLLAFDLATLVVSQVSANVEAFIGISPANCLQQPITGLLPAVDAEVLCQALDSDSLDDRNPLAFVGFSLALEAVLHRHAGLAVLEIEWAAAQDAPRWRTGVDRALKRLSAVPDLPQLLDETTRVVQGITGFDRVVVYRFTDDGSGEVLAETRADDMQPYLGLHFPESDIPWQARALYLRSWVRAIPDARYTPVPLVPPLRPDNGEALDLSHAVLRSISPMHLAYLANMEVRASLSMSLIVGGRLWGLISCGHRKPLDLRHALQSVCETIGRLVSLQIGALRAGDFRTRQLAKNASIQRLVDAMSSAPSEVLQGLADEPSLLLDTAQAGGAAIVLGDAVLSAGRCPDDAIVRELARWSKQRSSAGGIFATRQLGVDDPAWLDRTREAVGLLAIFIPAPEIACVLWFRPEQVESVNWGGRKEAVEPGEPTQLSPRRSFEAWKELVLGQSTEWDPVEIDAVANLRRFAIEIDLARQVRKAMEAVQARDDLVAVVSHDLRNPMSVVAMQAAIMERLIAQDPTETSQRLRASAKTIQRAADRMNSLLQDLLDLAKIEAGRFEVAAVDQSAAQLVQDACELLQSLAEAKNVALVCGAAPESTVRVDPERIFQVLSNLIGNAVKFSAPGGRVTVGATLVDGACEFQVCDRGVGIAPDQLARIFDRYWQAKQSDLAGAGLGLYIAKGIVEAHGGTIRAQSVLGQGTTISFTTPLTAAAA